MILPNIPAITWNGFYWLLVGVCLGASGMLGLLSVLHGVRDSHTHRIVTENDIAHPWGPEELLP